MSIKRISVPGVLGVAEEKVWQDLHREAQVVERGVPPEAGVARSFHVLLGLQARDPQALKAHDRRLVGQRALAPLGKPRPELFEATCRERYRVKYRERIKSGSKCFFFWVGICCLGCFKYVRL